MLNVNIQWNHGDSKCLWTEQIFRAMLDSCVFFIGVYDVCINVKHKKGYVCVMNI